MWIRDSSVQLSALLPRIKGNSYIQTIIEGAINMQAYYINNDPYANSYRCCSNPCKPLRSSKLTPPVPFSDEGNPAHLYPCMCLHACMHA